MEKKEEILRVRNLDISFETTAGVVNAVRGVNLTVNRGETVAIVGESGSGKSVSAKAIMGILAKNGTIDRGQITFSYYRINLYVQLFGQLAIAEDLNAVTRVLYDACFD